MPLSEEVQKIIDEKVNEYPEKWRGGVCAFGVYDRDDGRYLTGSVASGACHADLNYLNRDERKKKGIVVNAHKKTHEVPDFTKWVCREGPFSEAVLNKDNDDQILYHASVIDMEPVGNGGALWLCKALRHFHEDTFKLKYWTTLREHGLNGLQAFIGADILDETGSLSGATHVSLYGCGTPSEIRKFYDNTRKLKRIDGSVVRQEGSWDISWGGLKSKKIKKPDGWGGFVEVRAPCDPKEYVAMLKEIFEGDPKNVK